MTVQTVYCSITTWADCPGVLGEHYYARLRCRGCDEVEALIRRWLALVVSHGIRPWWHPSSSKSTEGLE